MNRSDRFVHAARRDRTEGYRKLVNLKIEIDPNKKTKKRRKKEEKEEKNGICVKREQWGGKADGIIFPETRYRAEKCNSWRTAT